ncbi:Nif3-like dinuclear metal center hexameric protein [Alloscardovia omnicolens]|uniref:Nif3-like dinuclear metal center hexameric protein n=1 Tax=Alloscardovia omnicolens TaxID=419015 RepID=UPI003A728881
MTAKILSLGDVVRVLEDLYPLEYAEEWDEPGLIVGDVNWPVQKIYCAVDPTELTVEDAIRQGAQLMIVHHPLYFKATHTVAGSTFRGHLVTRLIENHCGLWVGHTNVDSAPRGQGVACVEALGLRDCGPLVPRKGDQQHSVSHNAPGNEGNEHHEQNSVHAVHTNDHNSGAAGLGRVGELDSPVSLADFARRVSEALPATASPIQVSGDVDRQISRVAVLPGSGDSEIAAAAASGAQVYVTSDLRHHPVLDARQETDLAFINTPHAAIEKLVFPLMMQDVPTALEKRYGASVDMELTDINTDPWNMRV